MKNNAVNGQELTILFITQPNIICRHIDTARYINMEVELQVTGQFVVVIDDCARLDESGYVLSYGEVFIEDLEVILRNDFLDTLENEVCALTGRGITYEEIRKDTSELVCNLKGRLYECWMARYGLRLSDIIIRDIICKDSDEEKLGEMSDLAGIGKDWSTDEHLRATQIRAAQNRINGNKGPRAGVSGAYMSYRIVGDRWKCVCGKINSSKFCPACGEREPD